MWARLALVLHRQCSYRGIGRFHVWSLSGLLNYYFSIFPQISQLSCLWIVCLATHSISIIRAEAVVSGKKNTSNWVNLLFWELKKIAVFVLITVFYIISSGLGVAGKISQGYEKFLLSDLQVEAEGADSRFQRPTGRVRWEYAKWTEQQDQKVVQAGTSELWHILAIIGEND